MDMSQQIYEHEEMSISVGDLSSALPGFNVHAPRAWRCCRYSCRAVNPMSALKCEECDHRRCKDCALDSTESEWDAPK